MQIRFFFDDSVVTDIKRYDQHVITGAVFVGVNQDRQQTQFGHQQFAGAAPTAFNKLLDIIAFL